MQKQPVEEIRTDWQGQALARERGRRRESMVESKSMDNMEDSMVGSFGENGGSNEMVGPDGD